MAVAAGVNVPEINLVVNFDLPKKRINGGQEWGGRLSPGTGAPGHPPPAAAAAAAAAVVADEETYIHRVGRCSRMVDGKNEG